MALAVTVATLWDAPAGAQPTAGPVGDPAVHTGTIDGAAYRVEVPARWNGDLLPCSHGYRAPGADNSATVAPSSPDVSDVLRVALLERGYAMLELALFLAIAFSGQDFSWKHARLGELLWLVGGQAVAGRPPTTSKRPPRSPSTPRSS
jgi:hypothetical protein